MLKLLMLNTYDDWGGAAKAASRLNRGMQGIGIDSRLLVQGKTTDARDVVGTQNPMLKIAYGLRTVLGTIPVRLYPHKPVNNFTPALMPDRLAGQVADIAPDVIHLHWIAAGFCRVETLGKFKKPLVWTLHDSWAFTGGCHVPFGCTKYRRQCGSCPILGSARQGDLSRWTWKRKERAWRDLDLTVVAPSSWLADCARSSSLFRDTRIKVIPNGLDLKLFKPMDKRAARELLCLPSDMKIILFGAVGAVRDRNKGFHLLRPALKSISRKLTKLMVVIFGSSEPTNPPDLGVPVVYLGRLHDEFSLVAAYAAADIFVAPSLQENLPYTVMEAMACGTPCVAFRQGGISDLIEDKISGYLAQPDDTGDLARGIAWVLEDPVRHVELSCRARQKIAAEFALNLVARRYLDLYRELLGNNIEGR